MPEEIGPIEVSVQVNEALGGGAPAGAGGGAPSAGGGMIATGTQSKPFWMAPAASLVKVLAPIAGLLGIGLGINAMLRESKIMSGYLGALQSVFGAMIDMLLAPFTPFFDDILQASLKVSEWLGNVFIPWMQNTAWPWLVNNVGPVLNDIKTGIQAFASLLPGGNPEQIQKAFGGYAGRESAYTPAGFEYDVYKREGMGTVQNLISKLDEYIMKGGGQAKIDQLNLNIANTPKEDELNALIRNLGNLSNYGAMP